MNDTSDSDDDVPENIVATPPQNDLSVLAITLLKGVVYRDDDERLWTTLMQLQARVREHMAVLNLELRLDEAEGYAFLQVRAPADDRTADMPRLMARRPLSFPVSLLLALLRKKMAEFDAGGGNTRLILSRDDLVEMLRVFLPNGSNEAKLVDQIDVYIHKIVDLGFLRVLKPVTNPPSFEVKRILRAFIDAQWLADCDERLAAYQHLLTGKSGANDV